MKKAILLLVNAVFGITTTFAQTYVSGGIFSNAAWNLAGSPYIVTGNIVVLDSVTLTISPGVFVKFDNGTGMEIRGTLQAYGTVTDTIFFTSSSVSPVMGIWTGISFKKTTSVSFVSIAFAFTGLENINSSTLQINRSRFYQNLTAINYVNTNTSFIDSSQFDNNGNALQSLNQAPVSHCNFMNNVIGIGYVFASTISNCFFTGHTDKAIVGFGANYIGNTIQNNNIGLNIKLFNLPYVISNNIITGNQIGVQARGDATSTPNTGFTNNTICNNAIYNVENTDAVSLVLTNNCWCTNDSVAIANSIYDAYDNLSLGLVYFSPYLTNCSTGMEDNINQNEISFFPNPSNGSFSIVLSNNFQNENATLSIFNSIGQKLQKKILKDKTTKIQLEQPDGIYFLNVSSKKGNYTTKLIIQH